MKRLLQLIGVLVALAAIGSATPIVIDHFLNAGGDFGLLYPPTASGTGPTQLGMSPLGGSRAFTAWYTGSSSFVLMGASHLGTGNFSLSVPVPGATKAGAEIVWGPFASQDLTGGGTLNALSLGIQGAVGVVYELTLFNGGTGATASITTNNVGLTNYTIPYAAFAGINMAAVTKVQLKIAGGSVPALLGGATTNLDYIIAGIPEPGTFALSGLALVGLGLLARRRK